MKIAAQVLFHARSCPERPALVSSSGVATYGMVGRGVSTACARLERELPTRGAVVAIDVRNPFQHVALILALELCGHTSLSISTQQDLIESGIQIDAVLTDGSFDSSGGIRIQVDDSWFALAPKIDVEMTGIPDHQYYRIILSSGTTGRPKAVGYKPALIGRFMMRQCLMRGESTPRNLSMIGLSTLGVLNPLFALAQGGLCSFASTNEEVLQIIRTFSISRLGFTTAVQLEALVATARVSADVFPSLQVIHVSGSRLPRAIANEVRARLCGNLILSYASTEAGILTYARVGAANEPEGSAGFVLPWVEIEARDEAGRKLVKGMPGRLHVRSADIAEYVDQTEKMATDSDGWFSMGDIGYLRDDGLLVVEGRAEEIINSGGNIVAPDYVEAALLLQPGIREAAVFALRNKVGIDEIWAAIVPQGMIDKESLLRSCRQVLGDKAPKGLEIVESLPRTENGKLQRQAIRERFSVSPSPSSVRNTFE